MTSTQSDTLSRLASAIPQFERLAGDYGENSLAAAAEELRLKIEQSRFHLVVVGQFKRGKTSFLNALLGDSVLPVAVVPLTSVVTVLRYAHSASALVHFESGAQTPIGLDELTAYVTESGNPRNEKQVAYVEVFYPSPHLQGGITLIDTPGIASVHAHNTQVTYAFLPRIDAAVFITSPEPPLTSAEIEFLEDLREKVAKIFIVMNKSDLVDEGHLAEVLDFTRRSLPEELAGQPVFTVSAKLALDAKLSGDPVAYQTSALGHFESELKRFLRDERSAVFLHAVTRSFFRLVAELQMLLSLRIRAVQMPVEELRAKIEQFDEELKLAQQQQEDNDVLLRSSLGRLSAEFEERARAFAESQVGPIREAVRRFLEQSRSLPKRQLASAVDRFLAEQISHAFDRWRKEFEPLAVTRFREATSRFRATVNALARRVRETAGELFGIEIADLEIEQDLIYVEPTGYYTDALLDWGLGNAPLLLPGGMYYRYLLREALKRIPGELERNATRVSYDFKRRLAESVSSFQRELNRSLDEVIKGVRQGMQTALERHQSGSQDAVRFQKQAEASLRALDGLRSEIYDSLGSGAEEMPLAGTAERGRECHLGIGCGVAGFRSGRPAVSSGKEASDAG